ncbi:MAG: MIP/aquaporin family protein [Candidatus Scalinduaceae bacterium]
MDSYKKYVAELLGTFMLVFIGAGAICADYYLKMAGGQGIGLIGISAAFGFVVVAAIYATSYISGSHINPAVTVSFWVNKRMDANTAIFYIVSQLLGATIAGYFLKILFPDAVSTVFLGTCALGAGVGVKRAVFMEAIVSFLFVFTIYATAVDRRASKTLAGVAIGLVYLFGILVATTISGGALNPARVFGPAMASGHFDYHFVWWFGPIIGGVLAGLLYDNVFSEKVVERKSSTARK